MEAEGMSKKPKRVKCVMFECNGKGYSIPVSEKYRESDRETEAMGLLGDLMEWGRLSKLGAQLKVEVVMIPISSLKQESPFFISDFRWCLMLWR